MFYFLSIDPSRLHEEMTRYHVYLQVKKDLAEGRLAGAPFSTICLLTSYAAQVKFIITFLYKNKFFLSAVLTGNMNNRNLILLGCSGRL